MTRAQQLADLRTRLAEGLQEHADHPNWPCEHVGCADVATLLDVADAALNVLLDQLMPSRWFEDNTFHRKREHEEALAKALRAAGYWESIRQKRSERRARS